MSSIIKGGRIRNEGIIDLSERVSQKQVLEKVYEKAVCMQEPREVQKSHMTADVIAQREEELAALEMQINEKIEAANAKAEEILSQAYAKAKQVEEETRSQQTAMIADTCNKQQQMMKETEDEAALIKQAAEDEKKQMLGNVEGEVADTLLVLLQHIISDELNYNISWMKLIVRAMLQKLDLSEEVTLCISSKEYQKLINDKEETLQTIAKLAEIKEDESLNDTTCKLITSEGSIEYDVNQGLEKVISELRILKSLS